MKKGLTAVETLVVLGIVGSLATAVSIGFGENSRAQIEATKAQLVDIDVAIDEYTTAEGKLPRNLGNLIDNDVLATKDTLDPWGRTYRYRVGSDTARTYILCSRGPDGTIDTEDDICNDSE